MTLEILQGDALDMLRMLPDKHFHAVITSPPYWGLRDYGVDGQIGLEETPEDWCAKLVEVFREVRRVLRPDGVCFVNIGDSYASQGGHGGHGASSQRQGRSNIEQQNRGSYSTVAPGLKPKDLVGAPWMLAFALRADGWWLRSEIIWAKPNPMPESVTDRPTKAHEQVFLLTKSARYFWDAEAVREPGGLTGHRDNSAISDMPGNKRDGQPNGQQFQHAWSLNPAGRNLRSVWTIATDPLPSIEVDGEKLDHFASYPIELARRCILAGTSAKGCCPACGAPWARVVERQDNRSEAMRWDTPKRHDGHHGKGWGDISNTNGQMFRRVVTTTGWSPTCSCPPADPIPARVLDQFGGSGRTALAAEELDRDCTLIELNPANVRMAKAQIERAKARRMIGDAERFVADPGQLNLFD